MKKVKKKKLIKITDCTGGFSVLAAESWELSEEKCVKEVIQTLRTTQYVNYCTKIKMSHIYLTVIGMFPIIIIK